MSTAFRPFVRAGAILCYHGVATRAIRSPIHHTLAELEAAVAIARELGEIVPLSELVRVYTSGRRTAGLFSFTFDDAYLSLCSASDFLVREQVPVTVFAVSDALEDGRVFWWDRLDAALGRLTSHQLTALSDRWGIPLWFRAQWSGSDFLPRWELRQWIIARYAGRWAHELEETVQALELPWDQSTTDRSMTWTELAHFARGGLVEIGVHTRSHPVLPVLSIGEQREEIAGCHDALRGRFPSVSPVLAAPYGLFDANTISAARSSGLGACLSLGNRTLLYPERSGAIPRFCMMHPQSNVWLAPRLSGVFDRIRAWRRPHSDIPPLPTWIQESNDEGRTDAYMPLEN